MHKKDKGHFFVKHHYSHMMLFHLASKKFVSLKNGVFGNENGARVEPA